jgi:hypothetical protein
MVGTEDDNIPHQLVRDAAHQLGHGSPAGSRIADGSDKVESGATSLPEMHVTPRAMIFLSTFISALIKNQNHWLIKFWAN